VIRIRYEVIFYLELLMASLLGLELFLFARACLALTGGWMP